MPGNWLDELEELYEADKKKQQEPQATNQPLLKQPDAADILRSLNAAKLLQRVQSILLRGGGGIVVNEHHSVFDQAISLVWQGSISAARAPDPEDPTDYYFIAVGVKGQKVYVNNKHLVNPTPQTLRQALVEAAKQPGRKKNKA